MVHTTVSGAIDSIVNGSIDVKCFNRIVAGISELRDWDIGGRSRVDERELRGGELIIRTPLTRVDCNDIILSFDINHQSSIISS